MKKIIAFFGPKGAGKTTAAQRCVELFPTTMKMSFADPLRAMLAAAGVPPEFLEATADKNQPIPMLGGKTFRQAATTLGTEWGRQLIHPDIWVNAMAQRLRQSKADLVVIDDVRMQNEYDMLARWGAFFIRVVRDGQFASPQPEHASEVDWPTFRMTYVLEVQTNNYERLDSELEHICQCLQFLQK